VARRIGYRSWCALLRARRPRHGGGLRRHRSARYLTDAVQASNDRPVLIDRFLKDAAEVDVDVVSDGKDVVVRVMEHIERPDPLRRLGLRAAALQPGPRAGGRDRAAVDRHGPRAGVIGLMNVQFAVQGKDVYVLEVNPRASRTVPFVARPPA